MSIIEVQVPQLSESVAEGTLASWKKKIGEAVARDEILIDIETDKVVLEVPSPGAGVLVEIVKGDGETVVSGELIARIDTAATAGAAAPAEGAAPAAAGSGPAGAGCGPPDPARPRRPPWPARRRRRCGITRQKRCAQLRQRTRGRRRREEYPARRMQRVERGYDAISKGLVALAAGDFSRARAQARKANGLTPESPLALLLGAQVAQAEGDKVSAQRFYTAMLERDDTTFLALRGLAADAVRSGDADRALDLLAQARIAHIIGTTGLSAEDLARIAAAARHAPIVRSGNMSLGVNVLAVLVQKAAAALGPDWDIEILEMHHRMKVDAPSGTALLLGEAAARGRDINLAEHSVRSRDGHTGARKAGSKSARSRARRSDSSRF